MKAVKGNREYSIDESAKKSYQDAGFDIFDDNGKQIAYGRGKTVPYEEYVKLQKRCMEAEAENEILKERTEEDPGSESKKKAGK